MVNTEAIKCPKCGSPQCLAYEYECNDCMYDWHGPQRIVREWNINDYSVRISLKWEPIETAPRDGTWIIGMYHILGELTDMQASTVVYDKIYSRWIDFYGTKVPRPDYWLPMPKIHEEA